MPARTRARRLTREAFWLVLAAYRLTVARLRLTLRPGTALARHPVTSALAGGAHSADDIARALDRAVRHLPFAPTCLEKALALRQLLDHAGLPSTLVIGVRRTGATLDAHAWIERDGRALAGAPAAGHYTRLLSF